jgi:acetyl-CoA carboxylase biotin carboxyl carrier protein
VRLAKTPDLGAVSSVMPAAPPMIAAPQVPATAASPQSESATPAPGAGGEETAPAPSNLLEVTSPMVGTFYRAPAPDAPSYVEKGKRISKGDTLCIIEAMKLMNELESEVEGTVVEVLVENAQPVEYGQVLFRVDPA